MTITPNGLIRAAGLAAIAAGSIFIGVQVNHPHLDAQSISTTQVVIRDSLKVAMAALALVAITGMYARQVKQTGILGLVGYLLFSAGYLLISGTAFAAAFILPAIADANPAYVDAATAAANGGSATTDIGLFGDVLLVQAACYLLGGLMFGIALFRAGVLPRWAAALLAVGGVVSAALTVMPDAFHRLLALPNGVAMIALGYGLWRSLPDLAANTTSEVVALAPEDQVTSR